MPRYLRFHGIGASTRRRDGITDDDDGATVRVGATPRNPPQPPQKMEGSPHPQAGREDEYE